MKPYHCMLAGSGFLLGAAMIAPSAHAGCTDNLASDRELNIRSGPSTNHDSVGRIPGDACGIRIRNCDDGWCRVSYRGMDGYSSQFYLQRTERRAERHDDKSGFAKWLDVAGEIFAKLQRDPDWERIGVLQVGHERDRDIIQLDRRDGRFDALRMRVRGAPVDFRRTVVVYGNGKRDQLDIDRTIGRNEETGEIALRGKNGRFIDKIILVYKTARRRGPESEIEVWARKTSDGRAGDGRHARLGPDWERLGTKEVDRRRDRDEISIGRRDGSFDALRIFVLDNDVRVRKMTVRYGNGVEHQVNVDRRIGEGEFSDVIELRGKRGRYIDRVVLFYDTVGRGRKAKIDVWGRSEPRRQGQRRQLGPNWTRLGSKEVDRRRDRDEIQLSRRDGHFDAVRLLVKRNDVRVRRMKVKYGNGVEHEVDVDRRIGAGELSDVIELRGRNDRFLDRVVLFYDTAGRGPNADVEVWGRNGS